MDPLIKSTGLVSVMMTTYNRADLLGEAIDSVLKQSYSNWELLILDDASTDKTAETVKPYADADQRIRYLRSSQNVGISANRNRGFEFASGEYIAVLDSDDFWTDKDKLQKQVDFLSDHPDCAVVGTQVTTIDGAGKTISVSRYSTDDSSIRQSLLIKNQFTHSSVLMRQSQLPPYPYDATDEVSIWEDYDLFLRLGQKHTLANLPDNTTVYRWHAGNVSKAKRLNGALAHLKIIKKYRQYYPRYLPALFKGSLRLLRAFL